MECDIDFFTPLKNKYSPDKIYHGAWTGSSDDLSFFHSMTHRQVHSGYIKIKMKHQLRQSVHFTFHSWNMSSCFFREWVETEDFFLIAVEHLSMPIKTILSIIRLEKSEFKILCLKYGWEWPSTLGYKCNSGYHIITCNSSFTPGMYSDVQNIMTTLFA